MKWLINKCSELVQREYKIWHDWVAKAILKKLGKTLKFDYTTKPAFVNENGTHKIPALLRFKMII